MKKFGALKNKKEDYLILIFGFILVIIVMVIMIILGTSQRDPDNQVVTPTLIPTREPTPTVTQVRTNPPVAYDKDAQEVLLERKINRKRLSAADAQLKTELLAFLPPGKVAGVIHESNNISIEYIESLDLFKVEILTTNVAAAKDEANIWFRAQGMSQQGICDLPLGFYLNWEVATIMRDTDFTFNPLPNGCQ